MNDKLVCPVCGKQYRDDDFCPQDGTPLVPFISSSSASPVLGDENEADEKNSPTTAQVGPQPPPVEEVSEQGFDHHLGQAGQRVREEPNFSTPFQSNAQQEGQETPPDGRNDDQGTEQERKSRLAQATPGF